MLKIGNNLLLTIIKRKEGIPFNFFKVQYIPAGATIKRRIDPIHDTEDVEALKYSMNSTAKTPKLATAL